MRTECDSKTNGHGNFASADCAVAVAIERCEEASKVLAFAASEATVAVVVYQTKQRITIEGGADRHLSGRRIGFFGVALGCREFDVVAIEFDRRDVFGSRRCAAGF